MVLTLILYQETLLIVTDNPILNETLPNGSVFQAHKINPNLKDLVVCTDSNSTKLLKEKDQHTGCIS